MAHLTYFGVENFKRFEKFEMENIGQFNLMWGDNNVGKTSVLEALLFHSELHIFKHRLFFAFKQFFGVLMMLISQIWFAQSRIRIRTFQVFLGTFVILIIWCCDSSDLSAQANSSSTPLKSLTVGNKWIYGASFRSDYQTGFATRVYRIIETVVGDTVINNTTFAKVLRSDNNTIQYERANDTALYVWTAQGEEKIALKWNRDSLVISLGVRPWGLFDARDYYAKPEEIKYSFGSVTRKWHTKTDSVLTIANSSYIGENGSNYHSQITCCKFKGMTSIENNFQSRSGRNSFWHKAELLGSHINGVVEGDTTSNVLKNVQVRPNPTSDDLHCTFSLEIESLVSLSLINVLGQKVAFTTTNLNKGVHTVSMPIENIPLGVYFLHVAIPQESIVQQVRVLR